MSAHTQKKAIGYLTMGHVQVVEHSVKDARATIKVKGSTDEPYTVHFTTGVWLCDCPGGKHGKDCAHKDAAKIISPLRTEVGLMTGDHDPAIDNILGQTEESTAVKKPAGSMTSDEELDLEELFFSMNETNKVDPEFAE